MQVYRQFKKKRNLKELFFITCKKYSIYTNFYITSYLVSYYQIYKWFISLKYRVIYSSF